MSRLFRLAVLIGLIAGLLPALPSSASPGRNDRAARLADPVTTVHYVPTVQDAVIRVEVTRHTELDDQGQAVLLTYSPYNILGEPTGTGTVSGASPYLRDGIARAHADVLGTRGSTGCWDYGGADEQQSGVDVVRFLAGEIPDTDGNLLAWSNGNVGMTGASYDGTTATMVAATGLPALKAIEPIAAISHWYGYAFYDGVRYFLNSEVPTDEGFDTPLAFDHGLGDTFHTDNPDSLVARADDCEAVDHEMHAYSRNPDYTEFWQERDYTLAPEKWRAATLIRHGWNDYNVKQDEAIRLFSALQPFADDPQTGKQDGPDVLLRMTQGTHSTGTTPDHKKLIDAFWRAHLLDDHHAQKFLDDQPRVLSVGQTPAGQTVTTGATWPLEGTETHTFFLNRTYEQDIPGVTVPGPGTGEVGELSYDNRWDGALPGGRGGYYGPTSGWLDTGLATEELSRNDPWSNDGNPGEGPGGQGYYSLAFQTPPLTEAAHVAGSAVLDGRFSFPPLSGATLTPILVDIDPTGGYKTIQRGFLNIDYRDGRGSTAPKPEGWIDADVTFLPEDYTVPAGHRIGMILQSSNTVWAVPGNPAGFVNVGLGGPDDPGTRLHLPLRNPSDRIHEGFGDRPA